MRKICERYAKDRAEVEDILQEGFCQIFKDLKSWSQKGPLRAWLSKVILNATLMHIGKYRKIQFSELGDIDFENLEIPDLSLMKKERVQSSTFTFNEVFNPISLKSEFLDASPYSPRQ